MRQLGIYTVHVKPDKENPYEAPLFIREGFSWLAFLFGGFWALYQRLWWPAAGILVCNILLDQLITAGGLNTASFLTLQLGINMVVGCHANDWLRAKLRRRGYIITDIVSGENPMRAQQRFFDRYALTRLTHHRAV